MNCLSCDINRVEACCSRCGKEFCHTCKLPAELDTLRKSLVERDDAQVAMIATIATITAERDRYLGLLSKVYDQTDGAGQHDELFFDIEKELKGE